MIEVRYNLNMVPDKGSPIHINVSQNDDQCRTFIFKLYSSDGSWTAPASATATIEGRKDDGKFFSFACTYSNGEVTVVVQQQMVAVAGKVRCKLKLVSGVETIESAPFYFVVNPKSMPVNADMSKSDVVDAVAKATQKIVDQVAESIPKDYVKLNEDVSDLKSDIDNTNSLLFDFEIPNFDWVIGGITSQGSVNSIFTYSVRPALYAELIHNDGYIGCDKGYSIRIVEYSERTMGASVFVADSGWTTEDISVKANTYIAVCIREGNDSAIVQHDTSITSHIVYKIKKKLPINGTLSSNIVKLMEKMSSLLNYGDFYKGELEGRSSEFTAWYEGLGSEYTMQALIGKAVTGRSGMVADVISAYDTLMQEYPNYITKSERGKSSDGEYVISEYVLSSIEAYGSDVKTKKPCILIDGGMHGFEKGVVYGLLAFVRDLCNNFSKNPSLCAIREGVTIKLIPVINPWGFDRNDRMNANHINLNRNFQSPNWISILASETNGIWNSEASGLEPFDQRETAIIRDWVLENRDTCLAYINLHTNGQYNVKGYHEMNACMGANDSTDTYYNRMNTCFKKHIRLQTVMFPQMYDNIHPNNITIGRIQNEAFGDTIRGTAQQWVYNYAKQVGMCLEGFNGMVDYDGTKIIESMSPQSIKMNSEIIGNMIIQMCNTYLN